MIDFRATAFLHRMSHVVKFCGRQVDRGTKIQAEGCGLLDLRRLKLVAVWFSRVLTMVVVGLTSRCSQQPPRCQLRMRVGSRRSVTPAAWASGAPSLGLVRVKSAVSAVAVAKL